MLKCLVFGVGVMRCLWFYPRVQNRGFYSGRAGALAKWERRNTYQSLSI